MKIRDILAGLDYTENGVSDDVLPEYCVKSAESNAEAGAGALAPSSAKYNYYNPVSLTGDFQPPDGFRAVTSLDGGCEVSFFGLFRDRKFLDHVLDLKQVAANTAEKVYVNLDDVLYQVLPTGTRGNFPASVIIVGHGLRFEFRKQNCKEVPGVRVKFDYAFTRLARNMRVLVEEVRRMIDRKFHFSVTKELISRIDLNVTCNTDFSEFADLFLRGCRAWRVKKYNLVANGLHYETITGGSDIQLCLYNKSKELTDKYDADKVEDLQQFFGEDLEHLTRVEFRLHRNFLRSIGVDSFDDYFDKELSIVDYLTNDWFRLLVRPSDGKHADKFEVAPCWNNVRYSLLCSVPSHSDDVLFTCEEPKKLCKVPRKILSRPFLLISQGLGMAVSGLASFAPKIPSKRAFRKALDRFIDDNLVSIYEKFDLRTKERSLENFKGQLGVVSCQ